MESKLEAAVGMSRKWDAREAGREVAETAIKNLTHPPDFFLLFSTIHYEKYGGFQRFLDGVWDVLPKGTPLVGGTVAGFINPQGSFTRGATALAVSYVDMDVAIGIGIKTKKNPQKAARDCCKMIKKGLTNSQFKNKLLFEIISGGKIPQFPGIGRRRVIKSGLVSRMATRLSDFSLKVLQYGVGREEEILDSLANELPDYTIIGGSSIDNNNMKENFQFFGENIYTNSIVALGLKTDQNIDINTTYGLKKTGIKINITKKSGHGRVIHEIDGRPALEGFLKKMSWPYDFIDERLYRKTFFTPFGFWKENLLFPNVIGLILGKDINVGYKIEGDELQLLSASGKSLIGAVDENLEEFKDKENQLGIIVACAAQLETLGANIFTVREKLVNFFDQVPFLLVYVGGEDTYSTKKGKRHINESFNVLTISKNLPTNLV
jgi:hypothetical protein